MMTPVDRGTWWHQFTPVGVWKRPGRLVTPGESLGGSRISETTSRSRASASCAMMRESCAAWRLFRTLGVVAARVFRIDFV